MVLQIQFNILDLLDNTNNILELAQQIQDEEHFSLAEREEKLKQLDKAYRNWYNQAVAQFNLYKLNSEKLTFVSEYEGSAWSPKIERFLSSGLQVNILYDPNTTTITKWNYPFERSFQEPFIKQRNLLEILQATVTTFVSQEQSKQNWNSTICRVFRSFIDTANSAVSNESKKLTYEYIAIFLISAIDGLNIIAHDDYGAAEEVDLLVANESDDNFWRSVGNPFLVECKSWSRPLGAKDIRNLKGVMESKNIRTAILISKNGVTGDERHDAMLLIREARANNRFIIVLDQADLLEIASGIHPSEKIRQRFYALYKL